MPVVFRPTSLIPNKGYNRPSLHGDGSVYSSVLQVVHHITWYRYTVTYRDLVGVWKAISAGITILQSSLP